MSVITPNMGLIESTVNVDSGLNWENNLNSSLTVIDGHNHSPGQGVQINPSGININTDLSFNNNNATLLRSDRYQVQTSPLALSTDIGCTYVSGVDLYYNDINGNQIQMTSGGTVNATSSGITSGTASAAFVTSVLTVLSATNTPADIQGASILLGNVGVTNSKYLTLQPPGSMAANYTITLPPNPSGQAATNFLQIDTSGNMSASVAVSGGITGTNIAANGVLRPNLVAVGQQISSGNSGNFLTNSGTFVQVTNLTITITTSGRPVLVFCQPDSTNNGSGFFLDSSVTGSFSAPEIGLFRGATQLANFFPNFSPFFPSIDFGFLFPPSLVYFLDTPSAGTYTYTVRVLTSNSDNTLGVLDCVLVAYEL